MMVRLEVHITQSAQRGNSYFNSMMVRLEGYDLWP